MSGIRKRPEAGERGPRGRRVYGGRDLLVSPESHPRFPPDALAIRFEQWMESMKRRGIIMPNTKVITMLEDRERITLVARTVRAGRIYFGCVLCGDEWPGQERAHFPLPDGWTPLRHPREFVPQKLRKFIFVGIFCPICKNLDDQSQVRMREGREKLAEQAVDTSSE